MTDSQRFEEPSLPVSSGKPIKISRAALTARKLITNQKVVVGSAIVSLFILAALLAPYIAPYPPLQQDIVNALKGMSATHWFGTDELGRDLLSRVIYGARYALGVGVLSVGLSFVIGSAFGIVAGYFAGWTDMMFMRIIDVLLSFPGILMAIAVIAILGPGFTNVVIAIALYSVPTFARTARGGTLSVVTLPYVESARAAGARHWQVLLRYITPNVIGIQVVLAGLSLANALLFSAALSFLGLGIQPPAPDWGLMLSEGRSFITVKPHLTVFPGLAIFLAAIGFNLLAEGLRAVLDPQSRGRS